MSFEFLLRLVGMGVLALAGAKLGLRLGSMASGAGGPLEVWGLVVALVGALTGLIVTPFVTTRPARMIRARLSQMSAEVLVSTLVGVVVGLIVAALLSLPLSLLPSPFGQVLPIVGAIACSYFGIAAFTMRRSDLLELFRGHLPPLKFGSEEDGDRQVLLDTSVIIDGRIADISQTGFIGGPMLVPRFVLNELQHIADSSDLLRRNRGRRGLEMLNRLQSESVVPVSVIDVDVEEADEVDDKLVRLAGRLGCPIITNDYNLNRVAQLQGVTVLNINALANAVKAVLLPGETLSVYIMQEGRELGQGVGYLDDGTMVVVEEGRRYMDTTTEVVVTKVHQTVAGRMIFARPTDL
jgi:uncharacterized protein YacL